MSGSVLIIDGDQAFAEIAQNALEAAGLTVWVRQDGTFDTVRELRPHVLLLNVELPRGSGFAICSRIRRDKALKGTPIFLTSAETTAEAFERHAATPDSANDYAKKPIAVDDVVDRVGRLIAARPAPEEAPTNGAGPPPLPPPLASRGAPPELDRDEEPTPRPLETLAPELTPIPTKGLGSDDLWPSLTYDDQMRSALAQSDDAIPKGRVSPEERLQALRTLVKQHEAQRRAFVETWQQANERGQELARRIVGLTSELENRTERIEALNATLEDTNGRLETVEGEFRTFQDEITRIFKEKDSEEASRAAYLSELESTKASQEVQLQEAFERQTDDERRLTIIQEDLDLLQNEKDVAEGKLADVEANLAEARALIADLEKRLEMTDGVATERAEEIDDLRDRLDQLAFERTNERQRIEDAHEAKVESLLSEHVSSMEQARAEHEASLAEAEEAHAETRARLEAQLAETSASLREEKLLAIEALEATHLAQIEALEQQRVDEVETIEQEYSDKLQSLERRHEDRLESLETLHEDALADAATTRVALEGENAELRTQSEELEEQLASEKAERRREVVQLTEQLTRTRDENATLSTDLDRATANEMAIEHERSRLEAKLAETTRALEETRREVEVLRADLEDAQQTQTTQASRIDDLEGELDTAQADLFERKSEVAHLKKQLSSLEVRSSDLDTSLRLNEKALKAAENEGRAAKTRAAEAEADRTALEQQVELLEEQHTRLEDKVRDTETMLEHERARLTKAEDALRRAREQISAFESDDTAARLAADLHEEREARHELEASLTSVQAERKSLEEEVDELANANEELAENVQRLDGDRTELSNALDEAKSRWESTEQQRRELARAAEATEKALEEERETTRRLQQALADERSARQDLQESVGTERATRNELQMLFDTESSTRSELEKSVEALSEQLSLKEAELGELYAGQTDAQRRYESSTRDRQEAMTELQANLEERAREVANLESVVASLNEELEIHRAQAQGLSQTADRAEQAREGLFAELEAARRTVKTLEKSEHSLMKRVGDQEEVINEWRFATESMKGTLSALERDLEKAKSMADDTAVGQSYEKLLGRITRAVSMCMETLDQSDESMELPALELVPAAADLTEDDADIPLYTGEVEALDPLGDLEADGIRIVQRTPVTPLPKSPSRRPAPAAPTNDGQEPFAALMAELADGGEPPATDGETTHSDFGQSFEGEATSTDTRALTSKSVAHIPVTDDEDEDERNVTEIINLHELE